MNRQDLIDQSSGYFIVKDSVSLNIREGRQTQHRKPMKLQPMIPLSFDDIPAVCKRNQPWKVGQIKYLREAWYKTTVLREGSFITGDVIFRADGWHCSAWRPSIHMPKAYARTFVRIKRVWVERISGISEADALAEGCSCIECKRCAGSGEELSGEYAGQPCEDCDGDALIRSYSVFRALWQSIYPGSWERNDWVWACEFEVIPC